MEEYQTREDEDEISDSEKTVDVGEIVNRENIQQEEIDHGNMVDCENIHQEKIDQDTIIDDENIHQENTDQKHIIDDEETVDKAASDYLHGDEEMEEASEGVKD